MVYICLHLSNFEGLDVGKHIIHWAGISFLHVVFHLTESRRSEVSTLNVYLIGVKDSKWIPFFFAMLCNQLQYVYIYINTYLFVGNRLIICKASTCWYLFIPYQHHSVIISPYKSKGPGKKAAFLNMTKFDEVPWSNRILCAMVLLPNGTPWIFCESTLQRPSQTKKSTVNPTETNLQSLYTKLV